jgi:hypothetical protein
MIEKRTHARRRLVRVRVQRKHGKFDRLKVVEDANEPSGR